MFILKNYNHRSRKIKVIFYKKFVEKQNQLNWPLLKH